MGRGLGKLQKEGQRGDRAGEHQEMVNEGEEEEEVQARAEQHPGEFVKNPLWRK